MMLHETKKKFLEYFKLPRVFIHFYNPLIISIIASTPAVIF